MDLYFYFSGQDDPGWWPLIRSGAWSVDLFLQILDKSDPFWQMFA